MVFATMIIVVMILAAGLVIDLGQQRAAARTAQANADVIALDMARLADGRTLAEMDGDLLKEELRASAHRNNLLNSVAADGDNPGHLRLVRDEGDNTVPILEVRWGWFSEQPEPEHCGDQDQIRSENGSPWFSNCTDGSQTPNAARVTAYDEVGFRLLPVGGGPGAGPVVRDAIARHGADDQVSFRIGSYLLDSVEDGALNDLFGMLLDSSVDLQAVHYDGLLAHNLTIAEIAALSGITGSPSEVLDQTITFDELVEATIAALPQGDDGVLTDLEVEAIEAVFLEAGVIADQEIRLGDLVAADPTDPNSALNAGLNALDILQTAAHLAQCTENEDGNWECYGVGLEDLGADILGIAVLEAPQTHIVQGPRVYVGSGFNADGTPATLQTSQVTTRIDLDIATGLEEGVDTCANVVTCLVDLLLNPLLSTLFDSIGSIALVDIDAWLDIKLFGAEAQVHDLCYNQPDRDLDLRTTTALYDVEIGVEILLENKVTPIFLPDLINEFAISLVVSNSEVPTDPPPVVTFTDPDDMGPVSLGVESIGLSGLDIRFEIGGEENPGAIDDLLGLLSDNLLRPLIEGFLEPTLIQLLPEIDGLVGELSDRLGINLTGADLDGIFVNCGSTGVQLVG